MTLPSNIIFPKDIEDFPTLDPEYQKKQWKEMVNSLQNMYEDMVDNINGGHEHVFFTSSNQKDTIPLISGSTSEGVGTYGNREMYHVRQGLESQAWFDIAWTAHSGTGDLIVNLPYSVANTEFTPFVGVVQIHNINLSSGYTYATVNCAPNSFDGVIMECGSGVPSQPIALPTSGRLIGYVKYIGKEFD